MFSRKSLSFLLLVFYLGTSNVAWAKKWETGMLLAAERKDGERNLEQHNETRSSQDDNGNYSSSSTTTVGRSDLYYKYMYYTISSNNRIYITRQVVNLPWVKTATAEIGNSIEIAVDKSKLYIRGEDGKEIKTEVMSTSVKAPRTAPEK